MNSLSKKSRSLSILKVVQHAAQKPNVFDKPRAEPNKFELCRAKKRCMKMNVFDRPRAEPNKVRAMPSEEKAHGYEHKNFGEYSPDYTIYFL